MGWACAPIVLYQAIKEKKRARKTLNGAGLNGGLALRNNKSDAGNIVVNANNAVNAGGGPQQQSLSRSLSTDDSGSENSSSVCNQDEDMQYQMEVMDQREQLQLQRCPCGCPGAPGLGVPSHDLEPSHKIKTKEIVVRKPEHPQDVVDRIFTFEVLRYQGRHHCAEEISPLWKKDCRMWLWKGSELPKEKEKRVDKP